MTGKNTILRPLPPASDAVTPWVNSLRAAMFDAIRESDVKEIVENLVKKAKEGDPGALKMVFEYVLGGKQTMHSQLSIALPPPPRPTRARAGTRRKLSVMTARVANGYSPTRDGDGPEDEE